jgi:hypothetical protein
MKHLSRWKWNIGPSEANAVSPLLLCDDSGSFGCLHDNIRPTPPSIGLFLSEVERHHPDTTGVWPFGTVKFFRLHPAAKSF